ncbi:MAG: oxysterol-binding protein [archaeon]|nr:oxysterol-binding protein [archaeon]
MYFPLENNVVLDVATTKKNATNKNETELEIHGKEGIQYLRAETKQEKLIIINLLNDIITKGNSKQVFSKEYDEYQDEIFKNAKDKSPFELIVLRLTYFQNLFLEMSQKLDNLNAITHDQRFKNVCQDIFKIHFDINAIKDEMKRQFDDIIKSVFDYRDYIKINNGEPEFTGKEPIPLQSEPEEHSFNPEQNIKTEEENNNAGGIEADQLSEDEGEELQKYEIFSNNEIDFQSNEYSDLPIRNKLNKKIQTGQNMIKDFIKNLGAKKTSLPIYFNEPITMLQKQYERFMYSNLLEKAAMEDSKEMQMIYISGFIISEIFQSIGRLLKPFNPILGETYEYYDNEKKIRFHSEQVSHNPPISAFMCEGPNYAYFGDTRATTSLKIWKGCMEIDFTNKTHVMLKRTNDYYVFNRPAVYMKGLMTGALHSDYTGDLIIQNTNNEKSKCVITFTEESKKSPLGKFEGKVYNTEGEVVFHLGGNWNQELYYCKPNGEDKVTIVEIDKNEEYLQNSQEKYIMPQFACNLNIITEDLKKILPPTDSRMRKDLREYEEGDTDKAQKIKLLIEEKQRERHIKFEEDKIAYKPEFFVNEFNAKSNDEVYISNGKYWALRKGKKLNNVLNKDIFTVAEP